MESFYRKIRQAFNLDRDKEFYHRTEDSIISGIHFKGFNLYILICAILICSLGLDVNSTAVIIGAMLISPLMGPIIGMGFGLGTTNWDILKTAGRNYLIATLIALLTSTLYFLISPLHLEQSELLVRTQPTIYDVLIAFFGGFAGIMATATKQKGNVIPGGAIAIALMPPLCTAGFWLAALNYNFLLGALYLYIINTVFIVMATFLAFQLLRMPIRQSNPEGIRRAKGIALAIMVVTFLPAVYLGFNLFQKTKFTSNARKFIDEATQLPENYLFFSKIDYGTKSIELVYGGAEIADSTKSSISSKRKQYDLEDAEIKIVESLSKPIANIYQGLAQVNNEMDEKDVKLRKLEVQFDSLLTALKVNAFETQILNNYKNIKEVELKLVKNQSVNLFITPKEAIKKVSGSQNILSAQDSLTITAMLSKGFMVPKIIISVR